MIKQFGTGIWHFIKATGFLFKHKLWHYYLYPVLISILMYVFIIGALINYAYDIVQYFLAPYIPESIPKLRQYSDLVTEICNIPLYGVLAVVISILTLILAGKFSKYIVLIIMTPVFSLLSEKTDSIITGKTYEFSFAQMFKDVLRGTIIAFRNLIIELFWIAGISVISIFSGGLALVATPILFIVSAYFYGFSMLDYTCERRKLSISNSVKMVRHYKFFVIGNGSMYLFCGLIPIFGDIIGSVNGICGATTGIIELENRKNQETD